MRSRARLVPLTRAISSPAAVLIFHDLWTRITAKLFLIRLRKASLHACLSDDEGSAHEIECIFSVKHVGILNEA